MTGRLHYRWCTGKSALVAFSLASAACGAREAPADAARRPASGVNALFANGNFATGDFTSWTTGTNLNNGITYPPASLADLALKTGGTAKSYVRSGSTESQVPAGLTSAASVRFPKFGNDAAVINELGNNKNVNTLKQAYTAGAADVEPADGKIHVRFALAPVLENPGHATNQQPYFYVQLRNVTKGTVLFSTFNYSNQPGVPWKTDPGTQGTTVTYTDWRAFDIAPGNAALQIGDSVEIEVIAAGCSLGGHFGEVYVGGFGAFFPTLSVAASAPQQANAGTDLTYTFLVKNGSTLVVPNVVVNETLPPSTSFVSLSAPGATCTTPAVGSAGTVSCNFGWMNPSASATFALTVHIDPAATGTINNGNYEIHGDSVSPLYGPLVQTALTTGVTYADLAITKTDGLAAVTWGQPITYTVAVTNNGPSPVTGAVVTDTLPAQVAGASATWTCAGAGGGTCAAASGTGSLATTANLPVGGSVTYLVSTSVVAGSGTGTLNNVATVAAPAGITDPDTTNNAAADLDAIGPLYALTVNKSPPAAGSGTVVSSPAAVSCGPSCAAATASFASGTAVTLTAIASPGDAFLGWTSGPCSGSTASTCTVTLSAPTSVTASFKGQDVTGSVAAGSGAISCTTPVATGTPSTCTLSAGAGYVLDALTDNGINVTAAVAGGTTYTIDPVTAPHAVVATFKKDLGVACAAAGDCHSGQCVDGVCCSTSCSGQCQACNVAGKVGTCSPVAGAPVGTRPACASDGSLCGGTCDGVNPAACNYPAASTQCRVPSCAGGTETLGASCVGSGLCPPPATQSCGAYACQATACGTGCLVDADCAPGNWCSAGSCMPQKAAGSACGGANQCASGSCADGVCCNTACNGQCEACNLPGSVGVCAAAVGAPTGGRPACASDGSACGGSCNGVVRAACSYPGSGTQCRSPSCANGTATLAATCAGTGSCPGPQAQACGAYACGATACNATCAADSQCAAGYFCSSGACVAKLQAGAACGGANQCASGSCADGVCCDTVCNGQCEACNLPGSVGVCKAVTGSPQGGRAACASDSGACGGTCDGSSRSACAYPGASTACRSPSCADGTATLAATCAGTGSCPPPQTQACGAYACGATACNATCSADSQCAAGYFCGSGACVAKLPAGASCGGANQCASGACADGVCCDAACDGQCEACNLPGSAGTCTPVSGPPQGNRPACASDGSACGGTCDGSSRSACAYPGASTACRTPSCANGTATLAATCAGTGSCPAPQTQACGAYACGAAACLGNCTGDADCAPGHWCSAGVCAPRNPPGASCGAADQCLSGFCVDGICCDGTCNGQCEACDVPGSAGTCSAVVGAPHGGRSACASDGSACGGSCDGSSRAACAYPVDSTVCRAGSCTAGVATLEARCAGTGGCPPLQTQACGAFTCGPSACLGTCSVDGDCAGGAWCSGGVCTQKGDPGAACGASNQCATGFCADGVCCDKACRGQCEACDVPGFAGTCSPVAGPPRGTRPACASDATVCAGTCDGTSTAACAYPGAATACRAASCSGGTATLPGSCDGTGSCPPAELQPCGAFACGATSCLGSCAADGDCSPGNWCSGGVCVARRTNGSSCGGAGQCASGLCVDGVCCDRACTGQCEACDGKGSVGTCAPVSGAPHGSRTPCATDGSVCGGTCDGSSDACSYPGASTTCRAPECVGGVATLAAACDGAGACPPRQQESCGRLACGGSACLTGCATDGDCATGNRCAAGACVPSGTSGGWHVEGSGCSSAGAGGLLPLLAVVAAWALSRRRRRALLWVALLLPLSALAQSNRSFTVERFALAPGARDVLAVYAAQTAPPLHFDVLVSVDYANQPLRLVNGSSQAALVSDQWNLQIGASLGVLSWLEVGLVLPATLAQSGQTVPELDPSLATYAPTAGFGDPRVVLRARLVEFGAFALAVIAPFTIPLGSKQNYIGWDSATFTPAVAAEWSGLGGLRLLANAGVALRPPRTEGDLTVASAFTYAAAGTYRFPVGGQRFDAVATLTGETGLNGAGAVSPLELLFALRWLAPLGFSAAVGGGPGLSNGYGTPTYRLVAVLGFAPLDGEERR